MSQSKFTAGSFPVNSGLNAQERSLIISFQVDSMIKKDIDSIKHENITKSKSDIESINNKCESILNIADRLENLYDEKGFGFMKQDICSHIVHLFYNVGLEKDAKLVYQTLPDHYKNKNKASHLAMEGRLQYTQFRRSIAELNMVDLTKLDDIALREYRMQMIDEADKAQLVLQERHVPVEEEQYNQFVDLKTAEDNKFQKSEISKPLVTPEQMCSDPEYDAAFSHLKKTLDQTVSNAESMRRTFTVEYVPVSTEDCYMLIDGFDTWNNLFKPYVDDKYRSDHYQSVITSFTKILETSTKAAKDSRIPCAYSIDKHGNPIMRGLTKEQIDSMYPEEVNFLLKLFNTYFGWYEKISNVYKNHKGRCKSDRAVSLSPSLSHHA